MKITKEKLKELAAEIIAEDGGELKEFLGFFDSSTVKSLNGLVQAIAQEEAQMLAAKDAADKAADNYENPEGALGEMKASADRIKKMMETYQSYAKSNNVDLKDWNKHLKHEDAQNARRASSVVRTLMGPRDAVQTSIELAAKDLDNTVTNVARDVRAAMMDKGRQSATASKLKGNPMYDDDYLRSTFTSRNPMGENKMKITKANIKKLVAESIGDIFNENATISENADNDRVIEKIATAALGAIMNFGDFELERLIPDAGDRAEFTNKFKSGVIKDLKQFSELPPLDRRLPPGERLDEGNEEMAKVAQTLHQAAELITGSGLLETLQTKGMQDGDFKAYDEANAIVNRLVSLRNKVSK